MSLDLKPDIKPGTQPAADRVAARIGNCPRCNQRTRLDDSNTWRPFCSQRCKLVDLGDWLNGRYAIPAEEAPSLGEDDDQ